VKRFRSSELAAHLKNLIYLLRRATLRIGLPVEVPGVTGYA
jgi:hypothetical protein